MNLKEQIECKHGIRKNSGYACATCLTGSKYTIKRKYTKKRDKTNLKERIEEIFKRLTITCSNIPTLQERQFIRPQDLGLKIVGLEKATTDILKAIDEAGYHKHERINLDCSIEDMKEKMK